MSLAAQILDRHVSGIVDRLEQAFAEELRIGPDHGKRRTAAFLFLVARTMFDLDEEETLDGIVDGGSECGIDALYHEPPDHGEIEIALIRGKYGADLRGQAAFPENAVIRMIDAVGALFDPERVVTANERLRERIEEIRSFVAEGAIPRVTAIAASNGSQWTQQAQQRIDDAAREFGGQVDWRHAGPDDLFAILQAQKPVDVELQLAGQALVETFDFRRTLLGRMSVAELARLAGEHGNRLSEGNIRRYPGLAGNRVNEAVAHTLREPGQRPNFYFCNDGITITCSQFRHNALQKQNWRVQVSGLQIVNGGQTARTVQKVAGEIGPEIEAAEVLVRIYELRHDDSALVEAMALATSSRNPVEPGDLKADDLRQKALGESVHSLGYAYRAKRDDRPASSDEFTSAAIAESVLAVWRRRPHQARFHRREHFGALYDTIFTAGLNGAQAVIAALLHRQAENRRKRPPEDAPDFLAYGSRFVAMLMGRYLLEEMEIPLDGLDHRNFDRARGLIEQRSADYLSRAEQEISDALDPLFTGRERSLQRLSATFRRADLVEILS